MSMAKKVDVVVIGSGAGGGVVANELAQAGLSVVVFERGKSYSAGDFNHDELNSQYSLPPAYGPSVFPNPRTFRYTDRETAQRVYPGVSEGYGKTAAAVGGATVAYGAAAWRFKKEDFRMKSTYGSIPGTSVEDWPITYDDLEPYYDKAEYELGVSGLAGADPFAEPRKRPYPVPPLPINPQGEIIRDVGQRIGWHPFPPPFAILTKPYMGRSACVQCVWCLAHDCEIQAKSGTQVTVLPRALQTGRCELRSDSFVTRILTDAQGCLNRVEYFDAKNQGHEQHADLIVVACSATESARLLLNSANKFHPKGLGNSSGQVGRNLNDHTGADTFGLFDREIPHDKGPGPSIAFNDGTIRAAGKSPAAVTFITITALFRSNLPELDHLGSRSGVKLIRTFNANTSAAISISAATARDCRRIPTTSTSIPIFVTRGECQSPGSPTPG